jgi:hypothetical protein
MNVFEDIYERNLWGFNSGHGSLPSATKGYREYLQKFLELNNIKSVVDYGCGDWQFSQYMDWSNIDYLGLEAVNNLVILNTQKFGSPNIKFKVSLDDPIKLPKADLLIVKDVLQHFSNEDINKFIKNILPKFSFALITNDVTPVHLLNTNISTGGVRPLDLRKPPFNLAACAVYSFGRHRRTYSIKQRKYFVPWKKVVLLLNSTINRQ